MLELHVFRIKVYPSNQTDMFLQGKAPPDILLDVVKSLPTAAFREHVEWHIGNVRKIDDDALYFRIGRMARSVFEVFEEGKFKDQEFETAPYTHVLLDHKLELCAIAAKNRLAPSPAGISRKLGRLLNECQRSK